MALNKAAIDEIDWWLRNISDTHGEIIRTKPEVVIQTDASGKGWGAYDGINKIGGRWNEIEMLKAMNNEINYLELWAGFLALRAFCQNTKDLTVQLQMDNTTAYINKNGWG